MIILLFCLASVVFCWLLYKLTIKLVPWMAPIPGLFIAMMFVPVINIISGFIVLFVCLKDDEEGQAKVAKFFGLDK